jgi:hypothetical protein
VRLSISGGSTETRDARRRPICALPKTESGAFSSSCSRPVPWGLLLQQGPLLGGICDARALHPRERRQLMHPPAALGQDLGDRAPRTLSASPTTERWQRHGTASAHMIAMRFSRLRRMSVASGSRNSSVCR